ncbi:hypothetical protein [Desulfosporosinus nitroreducens]|uniref:hypothetical protein n=1 Tax=Desulfosporosinus nitroreducens TaxID=2018668 RepID=UPI00207C483C|nr:hypothetical protein [Desulfosporosinus nitroreducens]MCO1604471.1 hypothetical protein [Desulfosporosinus nitroreducens]
MGYLNDQRKLEIHLLGQHQQDARRITHTPCSRRACGQCGQVNPKAYFKFDLSKACGKALLRQTQKGFSIGWHCPQAQDEEYLRFLRSFFDNKKVFKFVGVSGKMVP